MRVSQGKRAGFVSMASFIAAIAGLAVAVSGCAAGAAGVVEATATPSPEAVAPAVTGASEVGPTVFPGVDFAIPADARSVVVSFWCNGGESYSVELGDSMMLGQAPLTGVCFGATDLAWPITERTGPTLNVTIADGVLWTATPTFSTEEFGTNAALASDCQQFSTFYSAVMNAEIGYTHYKAFDVAERTSRVESAASGLAAVAAVSQSAISEELAEAHEFVDGLDLDSASTLDVIISQPSITAIGEACNANQTPFILTGEFGG